MTPRYWGLRYSQSGPESLCSPLFCASTCSRFLLVELYEMFFQRKLLVPSWFMVAAYVYCSFFRFLPICIKMRVRVRSELSGYIVLAV